MLHGMYSQIRARVAPALWHKKPLATAILLGAGLLIPSAQADTSANTAQLKPNNQQACYVDGLSEQMQCGSISVPENYAKPDGKQIQIHYVVMPAIKPGSKNQALLAIAGGPGQSAIENARGFDRMLTKVRQTEDVILIDQRGTG
ncbi:alpha/beta hydrolase, partial [Shewanella sp. 0m-11]